MVAFARGLVAFRAVNYWARNADDLVVGRFLGAASLGLYSVAYQLIMLPLHQAATVIGDVMLPVLARCGHDKAQARLAFLRAVQAIALILFPAMCGIVIVAGEAVPVLFGEHWTAAVPVARILAVAGGAQALGVTVGWIYQSQGRSDLMFRWGVFAALVALIGIVAGLRWCIVGVAAGYTVAIVLLTPVSHFIAGRLIELHARELLVEIRPPLIAVGFMACAAVAVRIGLLAAGCAPAVVLAGTVATGVLVYAAAVARLRPPALDVLRPAARWLRSVHRRS
jgi:PST family polysaccharide transporter